MKKNDWFLAAGILAAAAILLCFQIFRKTGDQAVVSITVDGVLYGTYSLDKDRTVEINDTNRLEIRGGYAQMVWADCPDQVCVNHRSINRDGESIICLPNQVVVSIENGEASDVDGIAQVRLTEKDVVRHRLVQQIVKAYEKAAERSAKQ